MSEFKIKKFLYNLKLLETTALRPQSISVFLNDMSTAEISFRFKYQKFISKQQEGIAYYCLDLNQWLLLEPNQNLSSYLKKRNIYNNLNIDNIYDISYESSMLFVLNFISNITMDSNYIYYGSNIYTSSGKEEYTLDQYDLKLYNMLFSVFFNKKHWAIS